MKNMTRRDFLGKTALGVGSVAFVSQFTFSPEEKKSLKPKKMLIGFQT